MGDIRNFIKKLEETEDIIQIKEEFSVKYEIPAVLKAFDKDKAVLFKKVLGFSTQIVGGICGTRERVCKALSIDQKFF